MPRPVIAVDMDEVIADALGEHLLRYNRDFPGPVPLTPAHIRGRFLWDVIPPEHQRAVAQYIVSEDFFSVLEVMPDAQRVLANLRARYDIFIATAAMEVPSSFTAKFDWLARHFPFIPPSHIVFCGDKSILRADFLIDDNPRQLQRFEARPPNSPPRDPSAASRPRSFLQRAVKSAELRPEGSREGILFSSPSNIHVNAFRRVNNWMEVERLFLP